MDRFLDLVPDVAERYRALERELWVGGRCDPVLLELCRIRIAQLLDDDAGVAGRTPEAVAAGLDESMAAGVASWPTSPAFGARERACLAFTELYVIDPHSVTDEMAADVLAHLSQPEATALTMGLAVFDATSRARVALELALPGGSA